MNWKLWLLTVLVAPMAWAADKQYSEDDYAEDTAAVEELMDASETHSRFNYCQEGTLTCRTLVLLKEKSSGKLVRPWYDVFFSSERMVGSVGYFLVKDNGKYRAALDQSLDGKINIDLKFEENQNLTITYDRQRFPTVHDVSLKRVGTSRYIMADMSYDQNEAKIEGMEIDPDHPENNKPVKIVYKRVR